MVVRVRRAKSGLSQYLRDGKKAGSIYSRDQKDLITPILGSLSDFERAENYCVQNKNWAENYLHITFGFSDNNYQKIELLPSKEEQNILMKSLVEDYIKHHFSGYDIYNNIISYSELHYPEIKFDEHGNKRYPHLHLCVSFLNSLNDTKLRNLFATNSYLDKLITRMSHLKFGFEEVKRRNFKIQKYETRIGKNRAEWANSFEYLDNREELIEFLEKHLNFKENIDYKIVETKNNNYVKLINKSFRKDKQGKKIIESLNLRGHPFERFVDMNIDASYKRIEDMTQDELEEILQDVYANRAEEIRKRRSKKTTETLQEIYEEDNQLKKTFEKKYSQKDKKVEVNSLKNLSFQQQIFYKQYQSIIEDKLQGYYIKVDDLKNITTFENRAKNITITDFGDKIESDSINLNNHEKVKLMLDIAVVKGWDILNLQITGSDEFRIEVKKQILERIEESNNKNEFEITRPISYIDNLILDNQSKIIENEKVNDIEFIKKHLPVKVVLEFAKQKYNINFDEFEVLDDNKINNKTNRQKPKSVIDFFTKEIGISLKEAIEISNELLKDIEIIDSDTHTKNILENSNESNKEVEVVIVEEVSVVAETTKMKSKRKNCDKKFK